MRLAATIAAVALMLVLTGCKSPPLLHPPVLMLDPESAFVYDTLLLTERPVR